MRGCLGKFDIHVLSSDESSRVCVVCPTRALEWSAGFTVPGGGFKRDAFLEGKSLRRRDGTPAVTFQMDAMEAVMEEGKVTPEGRTRSRSQWVLCANKGTVDNVVGSIIHRATRACIMGLIQAMRSEERNEEVQVPGFSDRMYTSQSGIVPV